MSCRLVREVDLTQYKPLRGGVIPYYMDPQLGTVFYLGSDTRSGDLTDFGGGIRYRFDGNCIAGALREFAEESLGVFGPYELKDVQDYCLLCQEDMCILLLPIPNCPDFYEHSFYSLLKTSRSPEVSSIVRVPVAQLLSYIDQSGVIYERVRQFLYPNRLLLKNLKSQSPIAGATPNAVLVGRNSPPITPPASRPASRCGSPNI